MNDGRHAVRQWTIVFLRVALPYVLLVFSVSVSGQPVTTVITHGYSPNDKGAWVQGMAEAILWRAGEGSAFRYHADTGEWTFINTNNGDGTLDLVVLIFNWTDESDGPDIGPNQLYTQAAGDALYAALRDPRYAGAQGPGDLLNGRVVHFIGHSRGACVNSEATRRMALEGIPVDQVTALDPHPMNGTLDSPVNFDWGDLVPQKWNNVVWADNYWRADGGGFNAFDPDGMPLTGFENVQLSESALEMHGYSGAHSDTHLWYHGTIDLNETTFDGEESITPDVRDDWWPDGNWSDEGYFFSMLGGGSSSRPSLPPGDVPNPTAILLHGGFPEGTYAGWLYHGGGWTGSATPIRTENGESFAVLGRRGASGDVNSLSHNRFDLPNRLVRIEFRYRIDDPDSEDRDDAVEFQMIDADGAVVSIGTLPLAADEPTDWINHSFDAPSGIEPGAAILRMVHLRGGLLHSSVWIDDIVVIAPPPVPLTDFDIAFGSHLSGGLDDLRFSDDSYLVTRSGYGFSAQEPFRTEVIFGFESFGGGDSLDITFEGRINNPGGRQRVRLKDWPSGLWELVDTYAIGTTDVTRVTEDIDAAGHIRGSDGRIEVDLIQTVVASFSLVGFDSRFDLIAAEVQ